MTQLVILDEAPRLHDNPLLNRLRQGDWVLLRTPTEQTQQAQLKCELLAQFADVLRQLGYQVSAQVANSANEIIVIAEALQCQQLVMAEPVAHNELQLVKSFQTTALTLSLDDVNGLLRDTLRPELATLPPSYSQFRRLREPQLATSAVQPARHQASQSVARYGEDTANFGTAEHGPAEMSARLLDEHWWLAQVERYVAGPMRHYKDSRNGLLGHDFASFFSTPLALGLLSIRHLYQRIRHVEQQHGENPSSQWLRYELWWREYFRWVSRKEGHRLFTGLARHPTPPTVHPALQQQHLHAWQAGRTGVPLVDANMRLLAQTGLMSNRGRQLVASYLVFDLGVEWRHGARWFEQQLLDYDCASNYGNWAYISGALYSPARWFNLLKQAYEYDRDGTFVTAMLPELVQHKPAGMARHQPYVGELGLPFDRRWYEYLQHADAGLV